METTQVQVSELVTKETQRLIGARGSDRYSRSPKRVQWQINRPPFIHDTGRCYLVVLRDPSMGGCLIMIGRQGMCADIYTEACANGVPDERVDETVQYLWRMGR